MRPTPDDLPPADDAPKLSVCLVAYNQAALFREAIESVLTQETDFAFEVVVCDDASSDGTADVLREYEARYPEQVRAVYRTENVGPYRNLVDVHNLARGEYVAHVDGDDLCLPGKLQRQVDFLDAHPDVAAVWHAVRILDAEGRDVGRICLREALSDDGYLSLEDALETGAVGVHSAVMYRASARTTRELALNTLDWFYAVEYLSHGRGYQLADELGVYRRLEGTSLSRNTATARRMRRNFAATITHYTRVFPEHRDRLFTLSLLVFLSDLRAGSPTWTALLRPLASSVSVISPARFARALRRFRAASRAFRGAA